MTARHSFLFTLESGQSGLGIYTSQRDAAGFLFPAAIEVSQLAFTYADGTPALDGISLTIAPGESVAVAIATVLAMEPAVLLLDEPSANLDPRARRRLIRLLQGFTHTRVVATHDLDLVLDLCERTLVMAAGQIVADGPTDRIFADTALLERSGLEPPLALQRCPICSRG